MSQLDGLPAERGTVSETGVTAHRCSEDRVVFVEQENSDGWISTDFTVTLDR